MSEKILAKGLKKRLFSVILAMTMVFMLIPVNSFTTHAEDGGGEPTPLTFTAVDNEVYITFKWDSGSGVEIKPSSTNVKIMSFSDYIEVNVTSTDWQSYEPGALIILKKDDSVSFRGSNVTTSLSNHFTIENRTNVSGDVTSLTNTTGGDATLTEGCYSYMFYHCEGLCSAPNLPSTNLADSCYMNMFSACDNLINAPALPAENLARECYQAMFKGCTKLSNAPTLPATTLKQYCYSNMFDGCTSLSSAPALPAESLAQSCYYYMFDGCTSLSSAPALPATTLAANCYQNMFDGCTSLSSAPVLDATSLATSCYAYMFNGCTSLSSAPVLDATTLATSCYAGMFSRCTSLESAPVLPATSLDSSCYQNMFSGCTSLSSAPALPATSLAIYCYQNMFKGCTNLSSAPTLNATTLATSCYEGMFSGCASLESAPALSPTALENNCYKEMFKGCTKLKVVETSDETAALWKFPSTSSTNWNSNMISGLTAPGTLTAVEAGKMYIASLVPSHIHDWTCVAEGATLKVYCTDGCPFGAVNSESSVSLTLTVTSTAYTGGAVNATISETEKNAWEGLELTVPEVKYYGIQGTPDPTDNNAPSVVGKYTAKITFGDGSASVDFEITKQAGPAAPENLTIVNPSTEGGNDGKITGVTSDMEYSTNKGETWTDVTGTEITGLSAGDVIVRVKETDTVKAGTPITLTLADGTVKVAEDKQEGNFEAGGIKNTVDEVKAAVLTTEDKEAIEAGKDVLVWVEVKDHTETVTKEDKTKVEEKLDKDFIVGTYLDVSLWKQITGSDPSKVTDVPNGKVKIGFTIPKDLQKANRTYKIIRVHDGVAEIIDAVVDDEFGLTFETDRFSTYALVYTDAAAETPAKTPAETPAKTPGTGDTSPIALYVLMMGLAGVAMLVSKKRKAVR